MQRARPKAHLTFIGYFESASPEQIRKKYSANGLFYPISKLIKSFPARKLAGLDNEPLAEKILQVLTPLEKPVGLQLLIGMLYEQMDAPVKALKHYSQMINRFPHFYPAYTYYCTVAFQRVDELESLPARTDKEEQELKGLYMAVMWMLEEMKLVYQTVLASRDGKSESNGRLAELERKRMLEANLFYENASKGLSLLLNRHEIRIGTGGASAAMTLFAVKKEPEKSKVCAPRPL